MVQPHKLEVLDVGPPPDVARTARLHRLLQEIAATLQLPADVAEQLALTHTLADLQAHRPLHPQLLFDPATDHKTGPDHV